MSRMAFVSWSCLIGAVCALSGEGLADDWPSLPPLDYFSAGPGIAAGQEIAQTPPLAAEPAPATPDTGGPPGQEAAGSASDGAGVSPGAPQGAEPAIPAGAKTTPVDPPKSKSIPNPYKGVFYDNDFRYLEDHENDQFLGDALKRRHLGGTVYDIGGEYRLRQHNENILLRDNNFLLERTRLYGNLEVSPWLRLYAEAIDATSSWEDLPPRATEENRFDALNLFGDVRLLDGERADVWLRGGRQELLYGAQRLISPLDWSNTRRTFDGVKLFSRGEEWNADVFWVRPVPFAQHLGNDHNFDHPDTSQEFLGVYLTYKEIKDQALDLYYLRLAEYDGRPDFDVSTFGSRWEGKLDNWLWEMEGGYQFGQYGPRDHSAGFFTLGGGRKLARMAWTPTLWAYFDWASGNNPDSRFHGTFNQLFPLGHRYFGYMDLVGRQNIEDLNFLLTMSPSKTAEFQVWWHMFRLQQSRDALYDAAGAVVRFDPSGAAGRDVGDEIDLLLKLTLSPRSDLWFGYSHLFPGDFLLDTPGGAPGRDFFYTQFTLRF